VGGVSATRPPLPSLPAHLLLLWKMRLQVSGNRSRGTGLLGVLLGTGSLLGSGVGVALGVYRLFRHPAVLGTPLLEVFLFQLLGFLVAVMWIMWPIVTAGVDDSSELSRFATMPIRPVRLFLASSLAALIEPRALVFYPVLFAAAYGFASGHALPLPWAGMLAGTVAFALFNVAWGRVGLTATLNVLRHRRSAEIMGGGFLLTLFGCALVPPLDTSWLTAAASGATLSVDKIDLRIVEAALLVFSILPSGSWGLSVLASASDVGLVTAVVVTYATAYAALGFGIAFVLLLRFYAQTARAGGGMVRAPTQARASFTSSSLFGVLLERELRDLLHNPKVRLLGALPFFLTILLKLVQARAVIGAVAGAHTDVWIVALLTTYGGVVLAANFAQNAFAYDGAGLYLLFAAPVPLRQVLLAKNVAHGAASVAVGLLLFVFYAGYVHTPSLPDAVAALCTLSFQVLVILAVGNLLSVYAPRKFHAGLQRRDRVPPLTTAGGIVAAALALVPLKLALWSAPGVPLSLGRALLLLASLPLGAALYVALLGPALRRLESRREAVLSAITRE
jgi:ABC-2 type transport system permease protein